MKIFVLNRTPHSSSLTINTVVKIDANCDIKSATTSKLIQISKKIRSQCNANFIKNDDINKRFSTYYQNIRALEGKISELQLSLPVEAPHLICLTEHHLKEYEITNTHIPTYRLGAHYCRINLKQGGVCIYVKESIQFSNINLLKHNTDQDIEIAAIQLNIHKIR